MAFRDDPSFPEDPGLSWSQLRAFAACTRHLSFNAAAKAVGLTSSAIRYQVGLLEHRLGSPLFERRGGALALTDAGMTFAQRVEAPMRELVAACGEAVQSTDDGPLTLTAPPLIARHFLFAPQFLEWCDEHRIELDISDIKRDLSTQSALAAVRLDAEAHADLCLTKLLNVNVIIAAAPAIARRARPDDAAWWMRQRLIHTTISDAGWLRVWNALQIVPPEAKPNRVFSSYAAALEAAASGYGIILAPLPFAQPELDARRLLQISKLQLATKHAYSLVMRKSIASSERGRALRDRLVSTLTA